MPDETLTASDVCAQIVALWSQPTPDWHKPLDAYVAQQLVLSQSSHEAEVVGLREAARHRLDLLLAIANAVGLSEIGADGMNQLPKTIAVLKREYAAEVSELRDLAGLTGLPDAKERIATLTAEKQSAEQERDEWSTVLHFQYPVEALDYYLKLKQQITELEHQVEHQEGCRQELSGALSAAQRMILEQQAQLSETKSFNTELTENLDLAKKTIEICRDHFVGTPQAVEELNAHLATMMRIVAERESRGATTK
jgi:uncharacterized coiled-coil protein SlyX